MINAQEKDAQLAAMWEGMHPGDVFGPIRYDITPRFVDVFCDATDESHPWYMADSPFGGRIAPPVITGSDYTKLMAGMGYNLGFHARHHARYFAPIRVGDELTVTGVVRDKYQRRGLRYFALDYEGVNQRGERVYQRTITTTAGVLRDPSAKGQYRTTPLEAPPPRPGEELLLEREMTQERILRYSAQGARLRGEEIEAGFHTDPEAARRMGLRTNIGVALHYVAWLESAMTERLGAGWVTGGILDIAFVNAIEPGDVLSMRGAAASEAGDGRRAYEIVIQNDRDELVAMGRASGPAA